MDFFPQHLKEDRADLQATVELLQVRVQSLTHMLALQEEELTRKVGAPSSSRPCPAAGLPSLGVVGDMLPRPLNSSLWMAGQEGRRSPVPASLEDPSPFFPRTD